ncbi:hypothetical protein E2C01_053095 [Portunus trituberculatus]|uniref:Uncharacterized protein n=1 Tax=Portunus trituberculatus TaxID=210409 RepID=A0A5B7GFI3_PORTR|nr:hypothetical protein [Portunus trituberculatus]
MLVCMFARMFPIVGMYADDDSVLIQMERCVMFGGTALPLQDHIRILEVDMYWEICFGLHL